MDTRRILVADASTEFCGALSDILGGVYDLRLCHDGIQAQTLLGSFAPDVLVLDLALPRLDGIAVMKTAISMPKRPAILVTARFLSAYVERTMDTLGVDYVMMKPCDMQAIADHVHDMANLQGTPVLPCPSPAASVANMLLNLNIPAKRRGFRCLEVAIELYEQDPGQSVTKVLYPEIAKRVGGNKVGVERAIRAAVHTAWARRDERMWRMYFPVGGEGMVPRPTNRSFIAALAERIRRQGSGRKQA